MILPGVMALSFSRAIMAIKSFPCSLKPMIAALMAGIMSSVDSAIIVKDILPLL